MMSINGHKSKAEQYVARVYEEASRRTWGNAQTCLFSSRGEDGKTQAGFFTLACLGLRPRKAPDIRDDCVMNYRSSFGMTVILASHLVLRSDAKKVSGS
jgi:hypothetical protein